MKNWRWLISDWLWVPTAIIGTLGLLLGWSLCDVAESRLRIAEIQSKLESCQQNCKAEAKSTEPDIIRLREGQCLNMSATVTLCGPESLVPVKTSPAPRKAIAKPAPKCDPCEGIEKLNRRIDDVMELLRKPSPLCRGLSCATQSEYPLGAVMGSCVGIDCIPIDRNEQALLPNGQPMGAGCGQPPCELMNPPIETHPQIDEPQGPGASLWPVLGAAPMMAGVAVNTPEPGTWIAGIGLAGIGLRAIGLRITY